MSIDWTQIKTAEQKNAEKLAAEREQWKSARAKSVEGITVTTQAGNSFDGDEISQGRMARAILGLQASGDPDATVTWVLSDNTVIDATSAELSEALMLAGSEQAALWVAE